MLISSKNGIRVMAMATVAFSLLLGACAARNVLFDQNVREESLVGKTALQREAIVRSYQDASGDYYPDELGFGRAAEIESTEGKHWPDQQRDRAKAKAGEILRALNQDSNPEYATPLVILIHGFNVRYAQPTYANERKAVSDYLGASVKPVFWEVYWDGRDIAFPHILFAWSRAQGTGPLVGLKLRPVLNEILAARPGTPVRILTHSSGAFVAASLLGNNTRALPLALDEKETWYDFFRDNVEKYEGEFRVPQADDIRLAMIAPATPYDSFAPLQGKNGGSSEKDGVLSKKLTLIVGLNEKDVAVTKGPLPGSASLIGSTSLGSDKQSYECLVRGLDEIRNNKKNPRNVTPYLVDFEGSTTYDETSLLFWESHAVSVYLQRSQMPRMFRLLFDITSNDSLSDRLPTGIACS